MMIWELLHPEMTAEHLGLLPEMLDTNNPASAREQFHHNYAHGGGWFPFNGFKLKDDNSLHSDSGDPDLYPVARTRLRDELILLYPHSWVAIIQPDRSFAVARMD
jgi:hypothetical protein